MSARVEAALQAARCLAQYSQAYDLVQQQGTRVDERELRAVWREALRACRAALDGLEEDAA